MIILVYNKINYKLYIKIYIKKVSKANKKLSH
jgi:hypothetical protein